MDNERIQDLAIAKATTGLSGADLIEFEQWWPEAPESERALFAETVDVIGMVSLSAANPERPSAEVKSRLMASLEDRSAGEDTSSALRETPSTEEVPGYSFLLDAEGEWRELPTKGTRIKELTCSRDSRMATFILEMDPGSRLLSHHHHGAEEAFVLHGDLRMRGRTLHAGDHMRAEAGTKHEDLYSEQGCRALIITALENYPRRSIRTFDRLHRAWTKCKEAITGGAD